MKKELGFLVATLAAIIIAGVIFGYGLRQSLTGVENQPAGVEWFNEHQPLPEIVAHEIVEASSNSIAVKIRPICETSFKFVAIDTNGQYEFGFRSDGVVVWRKAKP